MILRNCTWGLIFIGLVACDAKFSKSKGAKADDQVIGDLDSAKGETAVKEQPKVEVVPNDVIIGMWQSQCLPNPGNTIVPANLIQYQFLPDNSANFKTLSYKDAACEARYTKADVDKLTARLQAEATAAEAPLTANEIKEYDVLWLPPVKAFSYKLGRKYTNGLIELDMNSKGSDGAEQVLYGSFYFHENFLYFAHLCSEIDAQFAACTPIAGDKLDRRGKKVNFDIAYEKFALPPVLPAP